MTEAEALLMNLQASIEEYVVCVTDALHNLQTFDVDRFKRASDNLVLSSNNTVAYFRDKEAECTKSDKSLTPSRLSKSPYGRS